MSERSLNALFRRYAADLALFVPDLNGAFGCPICMAVIPAVANLRDVVGEDHIVPQGLGGRLVTLTCKRCNNLAGANLESHLIQRVLVDAKKRPIEATVTIGDSVHRAEFHIPTTSEGAYKLLGIAKQSDPRQVAQAQRLLAQGEREIKFRANLGYVTSRSIIAVIRAAYLFMFRTFGYRYILDPSAAFIRAQIDNSPDETPVCAGVSWRITASNIDRTMLTIVTQPERFRSFLAFLKLDSDPTHLAAVSLPPAGADGAAFYKRLKDAEISAKTPTAIKMLPLVNGFIPFEDIWNLAVRDERVR